MKKISKAEIVSAFKGNAKELAKDLGISCNQAYHYIQKYSLKRVSKRELLIKALHETTDIDDLESKLGISKNRIYTYLKELGVKLPKRKKEFECRVSKKDLEVLYVKHTTEEIGKIYGVSRQSVCNWINGYGIKKRNKGRSPILDLSITREDLIQMYSDLGSVRLIAEKTKVKIGHINRLIKEYGIDIKPGPKPKILDADFMEDYDNYSFDELAEKYGVHKITLFRLAKRLGLSKRVVFKIDKEFCEKNKHRPSKEIALELGCSVVLINTKMLKFGVKRK